VTRSQQGGTEPRGLAVRAGIGLRAPHVPEALAGRLDVDVLEIHAENYFAEGGAIAELLRDLARRYAISVHGVELF
jgi:uncharacterized protein (UPF0276 family)